MANLLITFGARVLDIIYHALFHKLSDKSAAARFQCTHARTYFSFRTESQEGLGGSYKYEIRSNYI